MKLIHDRTLHDLVVERPDPACKRGRFVAVFEQVCHAAVAHPRIVALLPRPSQADSAAFADDYAKKER